MSLNDVLLQSMKSTGYEAQERLNCPAKDNGLELSYGEDRLHSFLQKYEAERRKQEKRFSNFLRSYENGRNRHEENFQRFLRTYEEQRNRNSHKNDTRVITKKNDHFKKPRPVNYVSRCIPGPGCSMEEFEAKYEGCQCKTQSCSPENCPCILRFGLSYSKEGTILRTEPFKENTDQRTKFCSPILECGPNCLCSPACLNRLIQHGIKYRTEVFDALSNKGLGLKACEFIRKGTFLCEYAGEIIDLQEARRRTGLLQANRGMNYILVLREHYGDQTAEICIDPISFGNLGRFINHSCDPNLWMTAIRYSNAIPKLCLFARQDINTGEELTFHYGGIEQIVPDVGLCGEYRSTEKICHCASKNCTGYLPFDESLFDST